MSDGPIYRAKVTRAGTTGVFIRIDAYWPGIEFGPVDLVANTVRIGQLTTSTDLASPYDHSHTVAQSQWLTDLVEEGDNVLVVETAPDDFIVVGVIRTGVSIGGS